MQIESDTNNFSPINFKSRNLYLAAYLLATDHQFIKAIYCNNGNYYLFEFEDKETCERQERLFMLGKTSVKTQKFIESIKYLKERVSR